MDRGVLNMPTLESICGSFLFHIVVNKKSASGVDEWEEDQRRDIHSIIHLLSSLVFSFVVFFFFTLNQHYLSQHKTGALLREEAIVAD